MASGLLPERPGEAPYARVDRLSARFSLLGFWSPSVRLSDLEIDHPVLHLITYTDGSTDQPHPTVPPIPSLRTSTPSSTFKPATSPSPKALFHYDDRAASFDFQTGWEPLDFEAS